jgi:hypothetical protein
VGKNGGVLDDGIIRLLLAVARDIEDHGLGPPALDALADAGVGLAVDWHPTVDDGWRATVTVGGRSAPLTVDADAAVASARALRGAAVHGVDGARVVLRPLAPGGPRGPSRPGRRKR